MTLPEFIAKLLDVEGDSSEWMIIHKMNAYKAKREGSSFCSCVINPQYLDGSILNPEWVPCDEWAEKAELELERTWNLIKEYKSKELYTLIPELRQPMTNISMIAHNIDAYVGKNHGADKWLTDQAETMMNEIMRLDGMLMKLYKEAKPKND